MAFNITSSPTNAEILASLLGDTTGLSNIQITTNGNPLAVGLFQDSPLNLSSGVLLSTGQATQIAGGNTGDRNNVSTVLNSPGTVANGNDAITLEITFDTDAVSRQLFLQYVFGSEEFLDFAGNSFDDRLTFELNGVNLAKLNDGKPVEVNSLTPSNDPTTFSPDFVPNLSNANPAYYQTVLDGYTVPLTITGDLLPNAKNRLVITIQDIGDGAVDSAVFLSGGSLGVSNPIPTVNLTVEPPSSVNEDGLNGIFYTFTRTGVTNKALSVNYQLGGTATFDSDYSSSNSTGQSGTVTFTAGSASTTLSIFPKIDALVEGDETITVNLLPASNAEYVVGTAGSATGNILDEDTPLNNISLTVSPEQVVENASGNLIYTFTRTGPTTESLRVDYNAGGTAVYQDDYVVYAVGGTSSFQGSVGSITFEAGASTVILSVDPIPDFIIEPLETVALTLTPSRYDPQLGRSRSYNIDTPNAVVGDIIDSPIIPPAISLIVQPGVVGENSQTNLSYFFFRTGSTTSPLTVQYFVRGTAALGTDYTVTGAASFDDTVGTVTFQAGSDLAVVDITPTADSVIEPTETVILQLDTIAGAIGGYTVNTFTEVVGSIVDATTPIINLMLEPQIVLEGGTTHLFYDFSRSGPTNDALTVNYSIGGDATFGADYNQTGASSFNGTAGSIVFAAGFSTARLEITSLADAINESTEFISLTLADGPTYAISNNNSVTGFIQDVPIISTVNLSLNRASVNEGGTDNLSYTFTRIGGIDKPLNVRYQITGTAINDTDYSTLGTSTTDPNDINVRIFDFAPGASTYTVRVDPTPDTLIEGDETVSLELLPSGIGFGYGRYIAGASSTVTGVIAEASAALPIIDVTLSPASVVEGGQNLVYLFTRTGSITQPLTIDYNISGTAAFTTDYNQIGANSFTGTAGSITFAANSATATLTITPAADAITEPDEIVTLTLAGNSTYSIGSNSSASGTILDVPPIVVITPPVVSLAVNSASVNEDGTANLVYTFTRIGSTANPLVVTYRVGGTASASNDYALSSSLVAATATVTFSVGSDTANVFVDPTPDSLVETDEIVALTLVPARSGEYTIGTTNAVTGTILDQDTALNNISLAVAPQQVAEEGTTNFVYTFTRTGPTNEALRVDYDFGGTAEFGTDYIVTGANSLGSISSTGVVTLNIGTVNFAAGSDTATVIVDPTLDSISETDENVTLKLVASRSDTVTGGGRSYNITTPDAIGGTIIDATPTVGVVLNPSSVAEGGTTSFVYTFTRTGSAAATLTATYSVSGTATLNADYTQTGATNFTATAGTVTFLANSNTATITIASTADTIIESAETIALTLGNDPNTPTRYKVGTAGAVIGTIVDSTPALPVISLSLDTISTVEGGSNLIYLFSRTGSVTQPLTVNYSIGGTAAFGADYNQTGAGNFTGTAGTITFAANSATATLAIAPAADSVIEPDETVAITLTGSSAYTVGNSNSLVGTIVDVPVIVNIPPTVNVAVNQTSVNEDGTVNLNYTFTRTGDNAQALSVRYQLGGTATFDADYGVIGSTPNGTFRTVDFAAGSSIATILVDPLADTLVEGDETVSVTLLPAGNSEYAIGTAGTASASILDQDTALNNISLVVAPNQVTEDGAGNLIYTFTRTGSTGEALRVDYNVGGTANLGADYSASGNSNFQSTIGSVNFAIGATTATVIIDPTPDNVLEPNETVALTLTQSRDDTLNGGRSRLYVIDTPDAITGTIVEPKTVVNLPPTQIVFNGSVNNNTFRIAENTSTANRIKIADIAITDDQLGTNTLSLSGADVSSFELDGLSLFLRSGVVLDFETKTNYNLVVSVDDVTVGNTPDVVNNFTLIVTDINEPPTGTPIIPIDDIAQNTSVRISRTVFLTGFTDPENAPLNVVNPIVNNGTIVNNNDGTFTLTPNTNYSGPINITYGVTDGVNTLNGQLRSVIVLPPENGLNFIGTTNLDVGAINPSNGIFAVNPNNINLVGDEINLLGGTNSVTVPGKRITLQPDRPNQNIQIGSADSNSADILDLIPTDLAAIANGFSKIVLGRANGTGNININSAITFRDPILLQSPGGQLNIAAPITLADDATLDFNVKSLVKSGDSVLTINGSNTTTFIGSTIINGGTLLLAKTPNTRALNDGAITINSGALQLGEKEQIDNAADLTLNGGTFNLNSFSETLDQLQVASNSSINLGNGSSKLAFGNSSSQSWAGILSIENWSSTSGETIRFGNNANGLTAAQLNNIQFVGFGRGATINASGFIAPIGSTVVNPTPDQDGVNDDIENLAPNGGDGNLDGILDSLQENVVSILNLGGVNVNNIATVIAKAGAKISGLRSLANPITTANLTSLANPIEFKVTGLTNGAATTVEYLIAKADQNRKYNTYVMFGATADNLTPHAYEFLYDGQTGAELFDTNGDGFTDKAVVHFVDGLRGDSDLTVNGEIQDPGAPGISNTPVGLSIDVNNVVQITGSAGSAIANFSLVANQTKKVNEVGFFKIDGTNKVKGIAANTAGFAQAALQSGQVILSSLADNLLSTADISRQLQLNAGDRLGFYLVQNGTVDAALQKNDFSNVVFSLDPANPAGKKAFEVASESNGSYRLKWEQGSATIDDDLILNLQLQNAPLNNQNLVAGIQGDKESELLDLSSFTGQNVQVNFTIKREAAYNDTVGFYKIEDAQGTVISITGAKLKPGEAGYQAAVVQNRITGIDLEVANGQTVSIDKVLQGGAIYAPFLIANANASNLNGNFSNVYTPYTLGNSDTTDHVRLLGDNTFGFEDLVGGGDKDFNDVVLKAVFKNS
jgi:autotransporter-associated beta strand protein